MGILSSAGSIVGGFNPYVALAALAVVAAVVGVGEYQSHEIHKWHTEYLTDEKTIAILQDDIAKATAEAKARQTNTSSAVTEVITIPGPTQTVIKTIHDAPIPQDCSTPALDILRNNT